jgi:hypothetical protein
MDLLNAWTVHAPAYEARCKRSNAQQANSNAVNRCATFCSRGVAHEVLQLDHMAMCFKENEKSNLGIVFFYTFGTLILLKL